MPLNIEWKARARNPERQRRLAEQLSERSVEVLVQQDTFFHVPKGRLKLRQEGQGRAELIFYQRSDTAGSRESDYVLAPVSAAEALAGLLGQALGVRAVVRKRRLLYGVGPARIHFDEVEGLGTFLEVEVVLAAGESADEGRRFARALQQQLEVADDDMVGCAYVDLLPPETGLAGDVIRP